MLIDKCVEEFFKQKKDYVSNRLRPTYPCGLEVQAFSLETLKEVGSATQDPTDREHGSFYIYNHPEIFSLGTFVSPNLKCPEKRWVLDYPEDLEFMKIVYEALYPAKPDFDFYDVLRFLEFNPEVERLNSMHTVIVKNYI
jgi:spore coat polysaccharide biosynthesis protein SpsF